MPKAMGWRKHQLPEARLQLRRGQGWRKDYPLFPGFGIRDLVDSGLDGHGGRWGQGPVARPRELALHWRFPYRRRWDGENVSCQRQCCSYGEGRGGPNIIIFLQVSESGTWSNAVSKVTKGDGGKVLLLGRESWRCIGGFLADGDGIEKTLAARGETAATAEQEDLAPIALCVLQHGCRPRP